MLDDSGKRLTHRGRVALAVLLGYSAITIFFSQVQCTPSRREHVGQAVPMERPDRREALLGGQQDGGASSRIVPSKPEDWMQRPPCNEALEEYPINNACWQATPRKPPCGLLWQHKDMCYRAVMQAPKKPVSGQSE